jgi:Repeat of unknown function (DUF5650)
LPNMVIVPVGVDGKVTIFNSDGNTDLLVDVLGWFPTNGSTPPTTPPSTGPSRALVVSGPAGSEKFGAEDVLVLSNGNYVVTDPDFDAGSIEDVGAVHLFDGVTDRLISTLRGSTELDSVGSRGVFEVGTSDVVVVSPFWDNNGVGVGDGAVTWIDGSAGLNGPVSLANSLVSTNAGGVTVLSNGNYVVSTPLWDDGANNVGAVTLASGVTGLVGEVSAANSLVGSNTNDRVGDGGVTALSNGNYVVSSPDWKNGAVDNVGAVTLASGVTGLVGTVGVGNSLVGSTLDDAVGSGGVTALTNGNYVVSSPDVDRAVGILRVDVGAVTLGNGLVGTIGSVRLTNSVFGNSDGDQVGSGGTTALSNGDYVVSSPLWNNGGVADVGAVTRADGVTGLVGVVAAANSLIGAAVDDQVGSGGVAALSNGNYMVSSPLWNNGGVADVGAVTRADGVTGLVGVVAAANSLIGAAVDDQVGSGGVAALSNGNYVVSSPLWNNAGVTDVGAVTWAPGATGLIGTVGVANSLIGTSAGDQVGSGGVTALTDENYVVRSLRLNTNGTPADAGAVTWADGSVGLVGVVGPENSLVGTSAFFNVGSRVSALPDGEYAVVNTRSITLGPVGGVVGLVTDANSLTIAGIPNPPFNTFIPSSVSDRFTAGNALLIGTRNDAVVVFRPGL